MPTRRELLAGFSALVATGGLRPAYAQTLPDLDSVLQGGFLDGPEAFRTLRILAVTMIDLRYVYNGPFGYETMDWRLQAFSAWRDAFGRDASPGFARALDLVPSFLNDNTDWFTDQMLGKLDDNRSAYADWMTSIGVAPDGRYQQDLIGAQAAMALLLCSQNESVQTERNLSFFDQFTWIWLGFSTAPKTEKRCCSSQTDLHLRRRLQRANCNVASALT